MLKNGKMFVRIEYLRENEKSDSRVKEWGNVCLSRGKEWEDVRTSRALTRGCIVRVPVFENGKTAVRIEYLR